ncbi:MAG: YncE family protein [Vicinamibacterales bacterium]
MVTRLRRVALPTTLLLASALSRGLTAQIAVSANDGKAVLVDGVNTVPARPAPDSISILDLGTARIRLIGEVRAPTAVVGPPESVAIAPNESFALVTAATRVDPTDATKTAPNDVVTVIDLKAAPPVAVATLHAGRGASGVSINRAGTLALVANRIDGTVSVFGIEGTVVRPIETISLNAPDSGPSHVVFTPDGRRALVTRNNDSLISILAISGTKVEYTRRDVTAGLKPYAIEITPDGALAIVAHIGAGATGGTDTLGVIDLRAEPIRAIGQLAVGSTPEGLAISPDGRYVAVTVMNGSNNPRQSPLFRDFGLLRILALRNRTLVPVTEARIGHWCQGVAWNQDSRRIVVQCMVEQQLQIFGFSGRTLTPEAPLKLSAGPAGIRTADRGAAPRAAPSR